MSRKTKTPEPDMSAPLAARILLSHNLQRVDRRLQQAARKPGSDTRHIHQLRIATRRSIAVLDTFRQYLPAKRRMRTVRQLKRIRSSAGKARDLDVLIERYQSGPLRNRSMVKKLKRKRKRAQGSVENVYAQMEQDTRYQKDCRRMLAALRDADDGTAPGYGYWARKKIKHCTRDFFEHRPDNTTSLSQLHRFRIAAKKFRYSLELLEPAFPPGTFKKVKPKIRRLQDLLGSVNDHAVAVARIHAMQGRGMAIDQKIQQRELDALIQARWEFARWWTPKTVRGLEKKFQAISRTPLAE